MKRIKRYLLILEALSADLKKSTVVQKYSRSLYGSVPGSVSDPDPPDPRVYGPPGSGSIRSMDPDPDPSIIKQN
jgi:hypothetical protein